MSVRTFALSSAVACLVISAAAIHSGRRQGQAAVNELIGRMVLPREEQTAAGSSGRMTNEAGPVLVTAAVSPAIVKTGGTAILRVRCRIASGYHIAALAEEEDNGPVAPTQIELDVPEGFLVPDPWVAPDAVRSIGAAGGLRQYEGTVEFSRVIASRPEARPGDHFVNCRVFFQACNERQCLRPEKVELSVRIRTSR